MPAEGRSARSNAQSSETGDRGEPRRLEHHGRENARFIVVAVLLIPTLAGVRIASANRAPDSDFYATSAQVIATLFVAITVDFFARQAAERARQDALVALMLAGQSWVGFFACLRALTGAATDLTRGLTAMGVTAASVLLSLALYDRMAARADVSEREKALAAFMILIVLFAAIALMIY